MSILYSIQTFVDSVTSRYSKEFIPFVLITTHGGYIVKETITGTGLVDKIVDYSIETKQILEDMKVYKIETAALGESNCTNSIIYDFNSDNLCNIIRKYMKDNTTLAELINKLTEDINYIHSTCILSHEDKVRREQMVTLESLLKNSSYYEKVFVRKIDKEDSLDFYIYNDSKYDMRVNLIQSLPGLLTSEPGTIDIYNDVYNYQESGPEKGYPGILLSVLIKYIYNILNIREFVIVDMVCSSFHFINQDGIPISKPSPDSIQRVARKFNLQRKKWDEDNCRRLETERPLDPRYFGKGGKRRKSKVKRRRKSNRKRVMKTRKNKKCPIHK